MSRRQERPKYVSPRNRKCCCDMKIGAHDESSFLSGLLWWFHHAALMLVHAHMHRHIWGGGAWDKPHGPGESARQHQPTLAASESVRSSVCLSHSVFNTNHTHFTSIITGCAWKRHHGARLNHTVHCLTNVLGRSRHFSINIVCVSIRMSQMAPESEAQNQAGSLWSDWYAEQQFSRNPWLRVTPTFLLNYSRGWAWVRQSERASHLTLQIEPHWQFLARHPGSSHPVRLMNTHSLHPCAGSSRQH